MRSPRRFPLAEFVGAVEKTVREGKILGKPERG
jgi:hypothetical protein